MPARREIPDDALALAFADYRYVWAQGEPMLTSELDAPGRAASSDQESSSECECVLYGPSPLPLMFDFNESGPARVWAI